MDDMNAQESCKMLIEKFLLHLLQLCTFLVAQRVEGQTMTHGIELWAMSLNIKVLTYEPRPPVRLDFSKIRSKLSRQQLPHKKSPTLQAVHQSNVPTGQSNVKVWGSSTWNFT